MSSNKPKKREEQSSIKTKLILCIGLAIAILVPRYFYTVTEWLGIASATGSPTNAFPQMWLTCVLLIGFVLLVERRPLSSLSIKKPTDKDIEWAFYFFGAAVTWSWLMSMVLSMTQNEGVNTIASLSIVTVIGLIITSAVTEEVIHRGYLLERIAKLTGALWVGALVSFILFVIPHIAFFGWTWLLTHGIGAVLIYVFYLWRRNLPATMLLHLLMNAPILIPTIAGGARLF
ncbi:hypothetical protein CSA80_02895 [Candidatus Saccharibacteria bacterium]|nr:MAG: hypothetical protein CR973_03015 [Candidatus Saccharibacteria bacterium]PID99039.1 MAG: hypothetical protein CSA80_02895 [Candidatus Saccharibacteria bacterium]